MAEITGQSHQSRPVRDAEEAISSRLRTEYTMGKRDPEITVGELKELNRKIEAIRIKHTGNARPAAVDHQQNPGVIRDHLQQRGPGQAPGNRPRIR